MNLDELENFKLSDAVKFHKELNPALWSEDKLDPEVRDQLLLIAEDFITYLGVKHLDVVDVTISGSNAAYSYTPHSDLDLHILVDMEKLSNDEVYKELFTSKKNEYNDDYDITVRGVPVELYVQDSKQPHYSLGEYSVVHDRWIKIPKKQKANFDENATRLKYIKLGELIETALKSKNLKKVDKVLDIIKRYRKAGLEKAGEFGPENLAFKAIRKQGLFQKLWDLKQELRSKQLSIEEQLDVKTLSSEQLAKKHKVSVEHINKQLQMGIKIEKEHTTDTAIAREIALDHLAEDPNYYTKLARAKLEESQQKVIEGTNCINCKWWKKDSEKPVGKDELNSNGGLKPPNKEYIAMSKRVDLVTLPGKDTVKVKGFCYHKDINDWVTERMCCAKWDAKGVIRDYKGESPLMEEELEEASGYIPSEKEKNDPRFKTALTVDVKPDSIKKNAKAFGFKVSRAGIPPLLRK